MFVEFNFIFVKRVLEYLGFEVGKLRLLLMKFGVKYNCVLLKVLRDYKLVDND